MPEGQAERGECRGTLVRRLLCSEADCSHVLFHVRCVMTWNENM